MNSYIPTNNRYFYGGYQIETSDGKTLMYANQPKFEDSPEDVYYNTQSNDSLSNIAHKFYNDSKWAWLIRLRNDIAEGFEPLPQIIIIPSFNSFIANNG